MGLDKGDMLFVIDSNYYAGAFHSGGTLRPDGSNPSYGSPATYESGNIYTIKNIPFSADHSMSFTANLTAHPSKSRGIVNIFKFSPATTGNYDFVASCSNRGTCDEGTCECFKGYTNDNCDVQSSLAV